MGLNVLSNGFKHAPLSPIGLPKGGVDTHETMLWATLTFSAGAELRFRDRYILALLLFHLGALLPLMVKVYCAITSVLLKQFELMWNVIEEEKITGTLAVPSVLSFMSGVPDFQHYDYSSLWWIISGATPASVTLIERFADLRRGKCLSGGD